MIIKLKDMREKCDERIAQLDREILFQVAKKQVIDEILADIATQEDAVESTQEMVEEPVDNLVEEPQIQDESY